jgi:flavin reductase (DIM6/NTAB) family NADH-FMN oxidoreductase RutF
MPRTPTQDRLALVPELNATSFRAAMSHFPTGVTLLTQGPPETVEVMTANSFTSVSLEPLLILVSLHEDGRMRARLDRSDTFAVHVLNADQHGMAALFARHDRPCGYEASRRLGAVSSAAGNALVAGAVAGFECTSHARFTAGDHVLFLGKVVAIHVASDGSAPLLFHRGSYADLGASRPRDVA